MQYGYNLLTILKPFLTIQCQAQTYVLAFWNTSATWKTRDLTRFLKKQRETVAKVSEICCSGSSLSGLEWQNSSLALKKIMWSKIRTWWGISIGPPRPIHGPGKYLSTTNVKQISNTHKPNAIMVQFLHHFKVNTPPFYDKCILYSFSST